MVISERVFWGAKGVSRDKEVMGITHPLDNIRPSCVLPKQARERHYKRMLLPCMEHVFRDTLTLARDFGGLV